MTAWFEKRWWTVGLMEEHGWRNVHEKKPNENNVRDETVVWQVELFNFTNGAAQSGAGRSATDSMHCRLWWKDNFPQFGVFRNCGGSEKRNTTTGWAMSLSWCRGFFVTLQKEKESLIESSREPCEEPDCTCSEKCVVWTSTWEQTPINVVSSPPRSFLLYFVVTSLFEKILSAFSLFPSIFKKKISCFTLLFWKCFPWSWEFSKKPSVFSLEGSSSYVIFFLFFKESCPLFLSFISKTLPETSACFKIYF